MSSAISVVQISSACSSFSLLFWKTCFNSLKLIKTLPDTIKDGLHDFQKKPAASPVGAIASSASPEIPLFFFFQYVMENILITGTPLLDSVGLHEPEVEELRETLWSAIQKALILLQAYARKYEKFLELNNNDIQYLLR